MFMFRLGVAMLALAAAPVAAQSVDRLAAKNGFAGRNQGRAFSQRTIEVDLAVSRPTVHSLPHAGTLALLFGCKPTGNMSTSS